MATRIAGSLDPFQHLSASISPPSPSPSWSTVSKCHLDIKEGRKDGRSPVMEDEGCRLRRQTSSAAKWLWRPVEEPEIWLETQAWTRGWMRTVDAASDALVPAGQTGHPGDQGRHHDISTAGETWFSKCQRHIGEKPFSPGGQVNWIWAMMGPSTEEQNQPSAVAGNWIVWRRTDFSPVDTSTQTFYPG